MTTRTQRFNAESCILEQVTCHSRHLSALENSAYYSHKRNGIVTHKYMCDFDANVNMKVNQIFKLAIVN
jgi:hypothetical protein